MVVGAGQLRQGGVPTENQRGQWVVIAVQHFQRRIFAEIQRGQLVPAAVQLCQVGEVFNAREVADGLIVKGHILDRGELRRG